MKAYANVPRGPDFSVKQSIVAVRIQIKVVCRSRDACLEHFAYPCLGAHVCGFFIDVFPVLIEKGQPVEQLGMFDLGHVAEERLKEVVVGVDKAGHHEPVRS